MLAWGIVQNFWNLAEANVHPDEPIYASSGIRYLHGDFSTNFEHPFTAKYMFGLAQLVLGEGVTSARIAAATAAVITGLVLWWWLRLEAGPVTGLLGAAMWFLLPRSIATFWGPRLDRFALLESFMVMFGVGAMAACWWWMRSGRRLPMALSAALLALAATSKVSIAVIAPVLVLTPVLVRRDRSTIRQAGAFVAIAAATALLTYLPAGNPFDPIGSMLDFQSRHQSTGHRVEVGDIVTQFPPWWTNLYWMFQGVGWLTSIGMIVGTVLVVVCRTDRLLAGFLAATLGSVAAFSLLVSHVALAHYYYALLPALTLLAALGLTAPWRSARLETAGLSTAVTRITAFTAGALLLIAAAGTTMATARVHPWGAARIEAALAAHGKAGARVLMTGMNRFEYSLYVDHPVTRYRPDIAAIAVFRGWHRTPPDPALINLVDDHPEDFERIELDQLELYIVRTPHAP